MADIAEPQDAAPKRKSIFPILVGLVSAGVLGAGGFYVTYSGLMPGHSESAGSVVAALPDIAFVPVDALVITLPPGARSRHLRFQCQLEVAKPHQAEVTMLMPRILDVLNSYLRAVETKDLEDPAALIRLRAHMLRRVQIVTGEGRVRDLLVTEFVLN
ncbi:MAG: flagellar basal body-associated FliL family protein [Gemmobacter sp.]|nr:flagellar basal body-associated FliL family protein [Gemmobacter sp.]